MRRATACALAIAALACGCRGILGIDPLELADASARDAQSAESSASDGAGADTGSGDTGTGDSGASEAGAVDAAGDADGGAVTDGSPSDVANDYAACVAQGSNCRPCCKQTYVDASAILVDYMIEAGCICGSGACADADTCGNSVCTNPGQPATSACAMCSDMTILPPPPQPPSLPCGQAIHDCQDNPSCTNVIDCLQACP